MHNALLDVEQTAPYIAADSRRTSATKFFAGWLAKVLMRGMADEPHIWESAEADRAELHLYQLRHSMISIWHRFDKAAALHGLKMKIEQGA